jgi:hypothetical protein
MIKIAKKGNKKIISISRKDWEYIGKTAGWADVGKVWNATKDIYNALPQGPNDDVFSLQTNIDPKKKNLNDPNQKSSDPSSPSNPESAGGSLYGDIAKKNDKVECTMDDGSKVEGIVKDELTGGELEVELTDYLKTIKQFPRNRVTKKK